MFANDIMVSNLLQDFIYLYPFNSFPGTPNFHCYFFQTSLFPVSSPPLVCADNICVNTEEDYFEIEA